MGTSHSANDGTTNGSISIARGYDCEEDFDYIGTGGFLIECGNERELLGVTKEQAELITKHSPFFQKCLQPGIERLVDNAPSTPGAGGLAMREATSKIIRKPDWSLALARHLIEILTKGKTTLPNLGLVKGILSAGDQALVDLRLSSLVNYLDPCSRENNFCSLVDHTFFRFQLRGTVKSDEWLELLDQDVLLFREETNFVVQIFQNKAFDRDQSLSRRKLDNKISDFSVHAKRPIQALLEIERCLSSDRSNEMQEAFSIYFETTEAIQTEHHELIDRLAGGEAYVRTCADAADYQTEGYTVKASLDVLARAVQPIREETIMHCAFRVDHPSPDTLGRFINACLQAKDYPRTLGLDAPIHRYFCQKSIGDIKGILEYMRDYSTSSKIKTNDFLLFLLSKESKCF